MQKRPVILRSLLIVATTYRPECKFDACVPQYNLHACMRVMTMWCACTKCGSNMRTDWRNTLVAYAHNMEPSSPTAAGGQYGHVWHGSVSANVVLLYPFLPTPIHTAAEFYEHFRCIYHAARGSRQSVYLSGDFSTCGWNDSRGRIIAVSRQRGSHSPTLQRPMEHTASIIQQTLTCTHQMAGTRELPSSLHSDARWPDTHHRRASSNGWSAGHILRLGRHKWFRNAACHGAYSAAGVGGHGDWQPRARRADART